MSFSRRAALAALGALALTACASSTPPVESTIYLVRHAEKDAGPDPSLTLIGRQRADILAQDLADAGLTAIWSTDYKRTRETAQPSSTMTGLPTQIYDANRLEQFAKQLKSTSGNVLVVGHSNTTPELVKLLGGKPGAAINEATEYDRLYVVHIRGGRVTSEIRRYGR